MTPTNKKPFGLAVAAKVAAKAIHDNVAPSSVVLCNLFYLQKTPHFPKELDTQFFSISKYNPDSTEKKAIGLLLDEFKKPKANVAEILETVFENGWVKKIPPKPAATPVASKPFKKKVKKPAVSAPTTPVVVIKKPKLGV